MFQKDEASKFLWDLTHLPLPADAAPMKWKANHSINQPGLTPL
jgi:hypothetical protein